MIKSFQKTSHLEWIFDGTLNNKTNVEAGISYEASDRNDSFANDEVLKTDSTRVFKSETKYKESYK